MNAKVSGPCLAAALAVMLVVFPLSCAAAVIDDAADLMTQQAQEKNELEEMKKELRGIKGTMKEANEGMQHLQQHVNERASANSSEVHLIVKESTWEVMPGVSVTGPTYNGQEPGPVIRALEGDNIRVFIHNQTKSNTSMCFHGMVLPQAVGGLPRKDAGMVAPGQTYCFQFIAPAAGTYWYHPQVIHADQMAKGLSGAIVITPSRRANTFDRDYVMVIGEARINSAGGARTFFTVNGKSAPAIPAVEVHNGERIRFRVINTASTVCPLYLTGHKFEVVGFNGSDSMEPHITRDTIALQPGDRYDLEFMANNPGVWSLTSVLPQQTSNDGRFPGGIAVVVRYPESMAH